MPPYTASPPRLVVGLLVFLLAVIFYFVGGLDPKVAALIGLAGVGLMFA
jgi:hypothetical protein